MLFFFFSLSYSSSFYCTNCTDYVCRVKIKKMNQLVIQYNNNNNNMDIILGWKLVENFDYIFLDFK